MNEHCLRHDVFDRLSKTNLKSNDQNITIIEILEFSTKKLIEEFGALKFIEMIASLLYDFVKKAPSVCSNITRVVNISEEIGCTRSINHVISVYFEINKLKINFEKFHLDEFTIVELVKSKVKKVIV